MDTSKLKIRDQSCSVKEATMNAAIAGSKEAKAVIESWRFNHPVVKLEKTERRWNG